MERAYRPLLPSKGSSDSSVNTVNSLPDVVTETGGRKKRQQIIVACNACRKRKSKCDGQRPTCNACANKHTNCNWTADPDAPPIVALKRKYDALKQDSQDLCNILWMLQKRPDEDAHNLLRWMRSAGDLEKTLNIFRERHLTDGDDMGSGHVQDVNYHACKALPDARAIVSPRKASKRTQHWDSQDSLGFVSTSGSTAASDGGSFRSPSLTPSTLTPRKVSIKDLLNHGSTPIQSVTSSVYGRTVNREDDFLWSCPSSVTFLEASTPKVKSCARDSNTRPVGAYRSYNAGTIQT